MTRPTYVYRLKVETPEGVPRGWIPARRHFMSRSGAEDRARLLRSWGATVTIERSEPVTWPE